MAELVVPSRMNLQLYKQKIVSAKKGHELLKKKCDALKVILEILFALDQIQDHHGRASRKQETHGRRGSRGPPHDCQGPICHGRIPVRLALTKAKT